MKTALVERWERRLKEYEDMREQMRLSRGCGPHNELRRCVRELTESMGVNDSR
jgi:hypothetical protein